MNASSNTNNTIDYHAINAYAYAAAIPISMIGLLTNILIFYIIVKHKIFRKTTYYLLRISVVSDIISNSTTSFAYMIVSVANPSYPDGIALCRVLVFVILSSYGASMMTLCVIGIDRYFAIVRPLSSFYRQHKYSFIGGLLATGGVLTLSITIPALFFPSVYPDDTKFCDFISVTPLVSFYFTMSTFNLYIIPAITLMISYGKIIFYMRSYVRPGQGVTAADEENEKKKKFIRMLTFIAGSYLLISWPFFATSLGMAITGKSLRQIRQFGVVYYLLAFFSFSTTTAISIINPFLYLNFDHAIRKKAKQHIISLPVVRTMMTSSTDESAVPSGNKSANLA